MICVHNEIKIEKTHEYARRSVPDHTVCGGNFWGVRVTCVHNHHSRITLTIAKNSGVLPIGQIKSFMSLGHTVRSGLQFTVNIFNKIIE